MPLLVLDRSLWRAPEPPGTVTLRRLDPDEDAVDAALAVAEVGFGAPGTAPGPEGRAERDAVTLAAGFSEHMRQRLRDRPERDRRGRDAGRPGRDGTLRPVGDVAEIVGVATLPAVRRQGLGGAVTGALVEIALESGIETVFLSAASDEIARVYERLGFRRAGTACFLRLSERPALAGVLGALTIAFTAILVAKASVAPAAAAMWRCAYAVPVLGALAWWEQRRIGPRPWRERRPAAVAGVVFAVNMTIWHYAIRDIGAGLSTVLGNIQVVVVPFLAWALLRERVPRSILVALPLVCVGVLFVSGALEDGAYGANPPRGVAFATGAGLLYASFLLIQRAGSMDLRRPAGAMFDMTLVATGTALIAEPRSRRRGSRAGVAERRLADPARADVAGDRLAADHRVAAAAPRRDDVDDPHDPADRLGDPRRGPALRGAVRAPARRLRADRLRARVGGDDGTRPLPRVIACQTLPYGGTTHHALLRIGGFRGHARLLHGGARPRGGLVRRRLHRLRVRLGTGSLRAAGRTAAGAAQHGRRRRFARGRGCRARGGPTDRAPGASTARSTSRGASAGSSCAIRTAS